MERLYLYGIAAFPPPLPRALRGLGGHPVFLLPWRGLAAVVSRSPCRSWPLHEEHLALHEAVVEEVMGSRVVLPARFNSLFSTEAAVVSFLEGCSGVFQARLAQVAGKVEMGLRVLWEPGHASAGGRSLGEETGETGPGARYLHARLRAERLRAEVRERGEGLVQEIQAALLPRVAESWVQRFPTERLLLTAAYLVERDQVEAFQSEVAEAQGRLPCLRFLWSGPWPPYHFVGDGTADE